MAILFIFFFFFFHFVSSSSILIISRSPFPIIDNCTTTMHTVAANWALCIRINAHKIALWILTYILFALTRFVEFFTSHVQTCTPFVHMYRTNYLPSTMKSMNVSMMMVGRRCCLFLNQQSNAMFNLLLWILSAVRCTNYLCTQYIIHAVVHARAHIYFACRTISTVNVFTYDMNVLRCDDDYL